MSYARKISSLTTVSLFKKRDRNVSFVSEHRERLLTSCKHSAGFLTVLIPNGVKVIVTYKTNPYM